MKTENTGQRLNHEWGVNAQHALYSQTGTTYDHLKRFPGALFDDNGYVVFATKQQYQQSPHLNIKKKVSVPNGIRQIPNYKNKPAAGGASRVVLPAPPSSPASTAAIEGLTREVRTLARGRNARLREAALKRACGTCEACATDFSRILGGAGVHALQVHHRKQLALSHVPRLTRLEELAVLCSNCHALIHVDRKRAMSVEKLRLLLRPRRGHA